MAADQRSTRQSAFRHDRGAGGRPVCSMRRPAMTARLDPLDDTLSLVAQAGLQPTRTKTELTSDQRKVVLYPGTLTTLALVCPRSCEVQPRADAALDVGTRHLTRQLVGRLPASAVAGYDHAGRDGGQLRECPRDQGFHQPTRQVHATDEAIDLLNASDAARVQEDIDHASVATTRQHEQPLPVDVADHRLVVPDPDVRLPRALRRAR